jgi:hypothetical protein
MLRGFKVPYFDGVIFGTLNWLNGGIGIRTGLRIPAQLGMKVRVLLRSQKKKTMYETSKTVEVGFEVQIHQHDSDEVYSCYVPAIEQYFSARNVDDIERKTRAFVKMYIDFWNEYNNNGEKKDFSFMKEEKI